MRQAKAWIYVLILVVIIIGLMVFFWWWQNSKTETTPASKTTTAAAKEEWLKNKTILWEDVTSTDTHKLDDGTFRMFFMKDGTIVYADSQDGSKFDPPQSTGIGENPGKMISNPSILQIKEGDWIMIYEEQPIQQLGQKQPPGPETQRNLLLATSFDGKNFTSAGIAIDSSKEDNYFASVPDLVMTPESKIRMYYVCGGEEICSAISDDGKSWTKEAGVRMSDKAVDPDVMRNLECLSCNEPIKWVMYFATLEGAGNKFYKAISNDGLQWNKGEIVLRPDSEQGSIVDPDLIEITPGKWRMFFGEMADGEGQTGGPAQINLYYADFSGDIF